MSLGQNNMRQVRLAEPIRISARFRLTLESAIVALEEGAGRDEKVLALLDDPDHRRRQRLLVEGQLNRAFRLRELLAQTEIRPERAA